MAAVNFYHICDHNVDKTAARLLDKVIQSKQRAVVVCSDQQRCQLLNDYLWVYSPSSFIPHGTAAEGNSSCQPIWITAEAENPNQSDIVMTLQSSNCIDLNHFKKCLDLFDGSDSHSVNLARQRWNAYKDAGNDVIYWQQQPDGQWIKQS